MHTGFWFNRIIEYWNLPTADLVLDHVRRGKVQVVQVGNFGVDFYGLADDPDVVRQWPGMPALGIEENLELAADLIPQIQEAGARVVGQFSLRRFVVPLPCVGTATGGDDNGAPMRALLVTMMG